MYSLVQLNTLGRYIRFAYGRDGRYIRQNGTYVGTVHTPERYIRRDGTYVGTVHDRVLVRFDEFQVFLQVLKKKRDRYNKCSYDI